MWYSTSRLVEGAQANSSSVGGGFTGIGLGPGETGKRPGSRWGGRKPISRPSGYPVGTLRRDGSQSQTHGVRGAHIVRRVSNQGGPAVIAPTQSVARDHTDEAAHGEAA